MTTRSLSDVPGHGLPAHRRWRSACGAPPCGPVPRRISRLLDRRWNESFGGPPPTPRGVQTSFATRLPFVRPRRSPGDPPPSEKQTPWAPRKNIRGVSAPTTGLRDTVSARSVLLARFFAPREDFSRRRRRQNIASPFTPLPVRAAAAAADPGRTEAVLSAGR